MPVAEREADRAAVGRAAPGRSREWLSLDSDEERLVAGDHPRAAAQVPPRAPALEAAVEQGRVRTRSRPRAAKTCVAVGSQYDAEPVPIRPAFAVEVIASAATITTPQRAFNPFLATDAATPFPPRR